MDNFLDGVKATWDKLKGYVGSISENWNEGRKPRAIAKVAIPLAALVAIIAALLFLWRFRVVIGLLLFAVAAIYVFSVAEKGGQHTKEVSKSDTIVMKHAMEGRNALLDMISIVCESLAEQTEIHRPGARDELAHPALNKCIHLEKGVPVVSVQLHYEGEIDPAQFKERFNDRMAQKLDGGEFSGKPPALFYDKDNTPHTAIQAIRCVPFKGKKYIRLDVVRVNEEALALMDDVERERQAEVVAEEQLDDGEL